MYCPNFRNVPDGKIYSKRYVSRTLNELLKSLSNLDQGMNMRRENHFNDISLKTALRLAGWESHDNNLKQALEHCMLDFQNGIESNDVSAGVYSVTSGRHSSENEKNESGLYTFFTYKIPCSLVEVFLEPCQTSAMEPFCKNSLRLLAVTL